MHSPTPLILILHYLPQNRIQSVPTQTTASHSHLHRVLSILPIVIHTLMKYRLVRCVKDALEKREEVICNPTLYQVFPGKFKYSRFSLRAKGEKLEFVANAYVLLLQAGCPAGSLAQPSDSIFLRTRAIRITCISRKQFSAAARSKYAWAHLQHSQADKLKPDIEELACTPNQQPSQ